MATNYNLKFYKGGNQPQEAGSIWFKDGLLSVIGADLQPEYFSGVRDASFAENVLTIVKANGTEVTLDFSDVASKDNVNSLLGSLRDSITELSNTVDANKTAAETGVQEAKDAAQDAADAAGAVAEDLVEYAEANDAAVDVIRQDLAGYKTSNDNRVKAVEDRATALEGKVNGDDGLIKKVETLESLFTGTEGGVQDIVTGEIAKLGGEATGEGTYVDVKVTTAGGQVTGVVVTEDFTAITNAITAEAERADAAEKANANAIAAEKARIDILVGAKGEDGNFVDAGKSVRAIASEEVAAIVAGADQAYDTLKEIADWIAAHPEDAAGYNERILANAAAIESLQDQVGEGTVDKRIEDAVKVVADDIAQYKIDEKVVTDGLANRVKAIEDLKISDEFTGVKNRVTAVETAVTTTLPAAIGAAQEAAEAKAAELATAAKTGAEATAQAALETAIAAEVTRSNKYADDAVAVEAAKVTKNAEAIEALQTQVNNGLIWAHFA